MQIIKKKEKIGNILFLAGIILELVIMMTDHSEITIPYRGRVAQLAFVLFGCKILTTEYTKKEWIAIIGTAVLGAVSYFTLGDEYILRAAVMVFAAKNIELDKTVKIWFYATLAGTAVIMLLSASGVLGNMVDIRDYGRGKVEARWCLGFKHANNVHCMFWYLTAIYLFMRKEKNKWWLYVLLSAGNLVVYYLTASRTGLISSQLLILGAALFQYFPEWNRRISVYIAGLLGLGACLFLTVMGALYGAGNSFVAFCDRFLTQRLNLAKEFANLNEWQLFPGPRVVEGAVDNGFAAFFYEYGIVMGMLFVILLCVMIFALYKQKQGLALAILITYIFVFFMERTFLFNTSLLCNLFFLLLFNRWYTLLGRGEKGEPV